VLKYRGDVVNDGVVHRGKDIYENLGPIDREHQPKKDGSAPDSALALRDVFMGKFNSEKNRPQSIDSFRTYLESYLAAGKGLEGTWRAITKKSYLEARHVATRGAVETGQDPHGEAEISNTSKSHQL
jgi:hypothetical protein